MNKIQIIDNFSARTYQQSIFANSMDKNSLVVLPTGLGKTVIAIMLCVYKFNKNNKKILFLAPTKPLVEQQENSFKSFFKNSDDFNFKVLTGQVQPAKRKKLYEENDFIFSTPQLIENDILNEIIDPSDFSLIVVDEAHRATGNYAYCFIAQEFDKQGADILALTASPGASKEDIRNVIENLRIEHIEIKKYEDPDVKPYVKQTKIVPVSVGLSETFKKIRDKLNFVFKERVRFLKDMEFLAGKNPNQISKKDLLDLQSYLRVQVAQGDADENVWKAISISAGLMKLQYGIELFESQEVSAAYNYFYNFFRDGKDSSKAVQELITDIDFRESFDMISKLHKEGIMHPKMHKLKELVGEELLENKDLRIIVFSQYRESASKIVMELSKIKELRPVLFVGQSKKGDVKLSQKQQKQILEKFREGEYNILVSTSVGEEGLDIPKVDLVMFYEPVPSAIRTIQRVGRTGRFKEGKAYVLITEGTRDVITRHVANAKERRMYKVLDELKDEYEGNFKKESRGLGKFLTAKESIDSQKNVEEIKQIQSDDRIPIYVDNRENNDLIKELYKLDEMRAIAKNLDVADIVVSEYVAIERKAKKDFVNSIIDKRLFPQLLDLAKNYKRPVLIIEGEESLFAIRNLNPNVIRASLSAIAVDLRIPIIYTADMKETAQMILTMAKRTRKDKKEISLVAEKSSFSENQELEKFISTIPRINVVTAKGILNHFKSVQNLVNASEKDLMECEGIGKLRAKSMKEFFEREYRE